MEWPGARFSKVPVTFRARIYKLKSKSIERWRSLLGRISARLVLST